jgi:GT2 family glycosyltransferase
VVDDGSQDNTARVCESMRGKLKNLTYIETGKNGILSRARNKGIEKSSGHYILFLDDDCIPAEDWIEKVTEALGHESIVAGAVSSPASNYYKLCHNIAEFHSVMPGKKAGPVQFIAGANMAFHRSVLQDHSGFNVDFIIGEDMELMLRAQMKGYQAFFSSDAVVLHDPERTDLKTIFRYAAKHASVTILLRNQYRLLLRTPFFFRSPVLILAASPLIALKVTFDIYLKNRRLTKLFWTAPLVFALKIAWCWGAAHGLWTQRLDWDNNEWCRK